MLNNNLGFVIINIEQDMGLADQRIKQAIKFIHKKQSIFTIIYNYFYYYLFRYFCLYRFFKISNLFFNSKRVTAKNYSFYIFDHGIQVYGNNIKFFIPYEYILEYGNISGRFIFHVFAKFNDKNKMEISNEITAISFSTTNLKDIINSISSNMDYHIVYNKINMDVIKFFYNAKKE
jgi:hypothetical protein